MDQSLEEWRPVAGYESLYEVSSFGRVRSVDGKRWNGQKWHNFKGRLLKPQGRPYLQVTLSKYRFIKSFRIHILVATAFMPPCPGRWGRTKGCYQIDHVNKDRQDNRVSNLRWLTIKDNVFDKNPNAIAHLRGSRHCNAKLTESQVLEIRKSQDSAKTIACRYEISKDYVYSLRNRKAWAHI